LVAPVFGNVVQLVSYVYEAYQTFTLCEGVGATRPWFYLVIIFIRGGVVAFVRRYQLECYRFQFQLCFITIYAVLTKICM